MYNTRLGGLWLLSSMLVQSQRRSALSIQQYSQSSAYNLYSGTVLIALLQKTTCFTTGHSQHALTEKRQQRVKTCQNNRLDKNLQPTDVMLRAGCTQHDGMHSQTSTRRSVSNSCFPKTSVRSIKVVFLEAGETPIEAPDNVYT